MCISTHMSPIGLKTLRNRSKLVRFLLDSGYEPLPKHDKGIHAVFTNTHGHRISVPYGEVLATGLVRAIMQSAQKGRGSAP